MTSAKHPPVVLVVSTAEDEHARVVLAELERLAADARLLNLSEFPEGASLVMRYGREPDAQYALRWNGNVKLDLRHVHAIWWRRPQPFTIHAGITRPAHRAFAYSESQEAFAGLWEALQPFWVNHPSNDERASHKPYQLEMARRVGLAVPETLITNDPLEARRFIENCGPSGAIYKAFTATEHDWRETRLVRSEELELLENVRHAPVIFQEYVPAGADVRATIVGDELYAAAIYAKQTAYEFDFRIDMNAARTEAVELPVSVSEQLLKLVRSLGLMYGAIDLRLTPDGRYVFLEINPAGQWLFVEQRTRQPITAALARLLVRQS